MSELGERVDAANREAVRRMLEAAPLFRYTASSGRQLTFLHAMHTK